MHGSINYSVYDTGTIKTLSYVADGGTAIGHKFGSYNTLSTTGAKILSIYSDNFTTEKFYVDKDGKIGFTGVLYATGSVFDAQFSPSNRRALYATDSGVAIGSSSGYGTNCVCLGVGAGYTMLGAGNTNVGIYAGAYTNEWSSNYGAYAGAYYQGSAKPKRICNFGYKAGCFSQDDDINIGNGQYGSEIIKGNQADRIMKILADLHVVNIDILGEMVLDISSVEKWNITGDVTIVGANIVVTGPGTFSQDSGDFLEAVEADQWYLFEYEVTTGSSNNLAKLAVITTAFAAEEVVLPIRDAGTYQVLLKTASSPTAFELEFFGGSFSIGAATSLKQVVGGNLKAWPSDVINTKLRYVDLTSVPSGTDQATAGAAAGELWIDTDDNILRIGV